MQLGVGDVRVFVVSAAASRAVAGEVLRPGDDGLSAAVALAFGRLDRLGAVSDRPVSEVRFSGPGIRMQIDGDRMETTDATVRAGRVIPVVA